MRHSSGLLLSVLLFFTLLSCKSDKKQTAAPVEEVVADTIASKVTAERTPETIAQSNSVMARLMMTKETSRLASYMVTADLANTLLKGEGPYTLFAPENTAFEALDEAAIKELPLQQNRQALLSMLQGHLVVGSYDSVQIAQQLEVGKLELTTVAGTKLTLSKIGIDIIVKDSSGKRAKIGKSDILASNGVVHVVDKLLNKD